MEQDGHQLNKYMLQYLQYCMQYIFAGFFFTGVAAHGEERNNHGLPGAVDRVWEGGQGGTYGCRLWRYVEVY